MRSQPTQPSCVTQRSSSFAEFFGATPGDVKVESAERLTLDRIGANELTMTQELIANMLGVRREGVTEAAGRLQVQHYISYRRGHITVLNRKGLEHSVCECYGVVKNEFARLLSDVRNRQSAATAAG